MIIYEISDPRLEGISITEIKIDRELAFADIYVSALEGSTRSKEVLEGLEHAQGFLRHELSQRVELRSFPRLRFHWDPTFERAEKIEQIIASLNSQGQSSGVSPEINLEPKTDPEDTLSTTEGTNHDG